MEVQLYEYGDEGHELDLVIGSLQRAGCLLHYPGISMNIMGKKGFEFAYMDGPDVVMKRRPDR